MPGMIRSSRMRFGAVSGSSNNASAALPLLGYAGTLRAAFDGPIVLMIENFLTGLVWRLTRRCPYLVTGQQLLVKEDSDVESTSDMRTFGGCLMSDPKFADEVLEQGIRNALALLR